MRGSSSSAWKMRCALRTRARMRREGEGTFGGGNGNNTRRIHVFIEKADVGRAAGGRTRGTMAVVHVTSPLCAGGGAARRRRRLSTRVANSRQRPRGVEKGGNATGVARRQRTSSATLQEAAVVVAPGTTTTTDAEYDGGFSPVCQGRGDGRDGKEGGREGGRRRLKQTREAFDGNAARARNPSPTNSGWPSSLLRPPPSTAVSNWFRSLR